MAPGGDTRTNRVDGQRRSVVRVLATGTLSLLVSTGLIDGLSIDAGSADGPGAPPTVTGMTCWAAILIGLAAGFLERLVPDLLDTASVTPPAGSRANDL